LLGLSLLVGMTSGGTFLTRTRLPVYFQDAFYWLTPYSYALVRACSRLQLVGRAHGANGGAGAHCARYHLPHPSLFGLQRTIIVSEFESPQYTSAFRTAVLGNLDMETSEVRAAERRGAPGGDGG
jgi:hypothetical protein